MRAFSRCHGLAAAAAIAGGLVFSGSAYAQKIGVAATVKNDVSRVQGGAASPISSGEGVVRNEVVKTGSESAARLVFVDDTNLAVGPISTVTLDKFVYSGDAGAGKVAVNLVRGAFRFTTGNADKKAYQINTPVATIGVRGTVFDVLSEQGRTTVVLVEGEVIVCTRDGRHCQTLTHEGDTAIVTATSVSLGLPGGGSRHFTFQSFCSGADGLCSVTAIASLDPQNGGGGGGALCGR